MKTRAHQRYRNEADKIVVGVTTITGLLAKPQLIPWANRMGLNGIDTTKFVDDKASIGTLAHQMVQDHLLKVDTDVSDYSPKQVSQAENSVLSYFEWEKNHTIKPILIEEKMVSELHQYGGQLDIYAYLDDIPTLIDLKTGSGIYPEMGVQLSAYRQLLIEGGHDIEQCMILNIGRDETEDFQEKKYENIEKYWAIFLHLKAVYDLKKEVKWR